MCLDSKWRIFTAPRTTGVSAWPGATWAPPRVARPPSASPVSMETPRRSELHVAFLQNIRQMSRNKLLTLNLQCRSFQACAKHGQTCLYVRVFLIWCLGLFSAGTLVAMHFKLASTDWFVRAEGGSDRSFFL